MKNLFISCALTMLISGNIQSEEIKVDPMVEQLAHHGIEDEHVDEEKELAHHNKEDEHSHDHIITV